MHVLLLIWGQNIGVCGADFSPLDVLLSFSLGGNNLNNATKDAIKKAWNDRGALYV